MSLARSFRRLPWSRARKAAALALLAYVALEALMVLAVAVIAGLEVSGAVGWPWWAVAAPGGGCVVIAALALAVDVTCRAVAGRARKAVNVTPISAARSLRDGKRAKRT